MRESNFCFPGQYRACVCITSQLYDRRALDTTSPLPLFNSLTQLTYLTSTSPRIREIMTMDGGLERLVRILHDFCMCPPPPENPTLLYGLSPPGSRPPKLTPTLNPKSFDKHAAYRFSLAFQCLVNIGVRGSEPIRSRVVQAGTLDVVGCILEAWLANKGFPVGPSATSGLPRESREQRQRQARRQAEQRQRQEAAELHRALQRQIQVERLRRLEQEITSVDTYTPDDDAMDVSLSGNSTDQSNSTTSRPQFIRTASHSNSDTDVDTSTDTSANATPVGSNTPTAAVIVSSRDRSGTIIARRVWGEMIHDRTNADNATPTATRHRTFRDRTGRHTQRPSPSPSPDTSRPETETEDDGEMDAEGDGERDVDMDRSSNDQPSASPSPERRPSVSLTRPHRAVGIVSDDPPAATHIIINDADVGVGMGAVGLAVGGEGGVEDGIISLEPNDDFAMGAPPGAPGAIDDGTTPRRVELNIPREERRMARGAAPDITPRAGIASLPVDGTAPRQMPVAMTTDPATGRPPFRRNYVSIWTPPAPPVAEALAAAAANVPRVFQQTPNVNTTANTNTATTASFSRASTSQHRDTDSGPYRDEDVLLSLQLLAYLSKYPHVRQAFYKPRMTFHPATTNLPGKGSALNGSMNDPNGRSAYARTQYGAYGNNSFGEGSSSRPNSAAAAMKENLLRAFTGRGKEKERNPFPSISSLSTAGASSSSSGLSTSALTSSSSPSTTTPSTATPMRQTNVFALVERFTYKPSESEIEAGTSLPRLPREIQYWAGVIMRNACRKDDSRGGIRQCANMLCGRWESYPREFAKCRQCRKAKYCGKECQSIAWNEGHRFWCSAKDGDEEAATDQTQAAQGQSSIGTATTTVPGVAATARPGTGVTVASTPGGDNSVGPVEVAGSDDQAGLAGVGAGLTMTPGGTITGRTERRERENNRERERRLAADRSLAFPELGAGNQRGTGSGTVNSLAINAVFGTPAGSAGTIGRAEGSATRERILQSSGLRTRAIDPNFLRTYRLQQHGQGLVSTSRDGQPVYTVYDQQGSNQDQSTRRRSETVIGVTMTPAQAYTEFQQGLTNNYGRLQPVSRYALPGPTPPAPMDTTPVTPSGSSSTATLRVDMSMIAGPSRRRQADNSFRSPTGEQDMVIG